MGQSVFPPAASGPTLSEIQTAISTYSKGPLDVTWTNIGSSQSFNAASVTFTGLSGYKYLKFVTQGVGNLNNAGTYRITFNSDSGNNYAWSAGVLQNSTYPYGIRSGNDSQYIYFGSSSASNWRHDMELIVLNSNSTAHKHFRAKGSWSEVASNHMELTGVYRSTSAISSLTLTTNAGSFDNTSPYGFYIYGAN